jgi:hypothetical protein
MARCRRWAAVVATLAAAGAGGPTAASAADHGSGPPAVLGHTDLGGAGLNGDVAVVGTTAVVGGGLIPNTGYHQERYNPLPCLGTSVKVVDLRDPSAPHAVATIPVPEGVAAISVDALRVSTPSFTGDLAAIALDDGPSEAGPTGCTVNAAHPSPSGVDRGVMFYDITTPADPKFLGRYMADQTPVDDVPPAGPGCGPPPDGNTDRCATGQHSVALAQRPDGKVIALTVELVADFRNKPSGDVRVVDVTDPRRPTQLAAWPPLGRRPGSFSPNGCAPFVNGHAATLSADGREAAVAFLDAGTFTLDLSNPAAPAQVAQVGFAADRPVEGNAGFATRVEAGDRAMVLESDEGWFPAGTSLVVDAPSPLAGTKFACEGLPTLFDPTGQAQLYKRPGAKVSADLTYAGRGCPARGAGNATPEDPYLADPRGRIVVLDTAKVNATQPDVAQAACNNTTRVRRAQDAGAVAVLFARVPLAPFSASPQAIGWGGSATDITIPGAMVDQPDADALRGALCPAVEGGLCAGGQPVRGSLVDTEGEWGGVRLIDLSDPVGPRVAGTWRPPEAAVYPPPDLGVYAPGSSVADGHLAYVAWHAAGLRVLDVGGDAPREVASFVPGAQADPAKVLPTATDVVGVAVGARFVVVSDTNSGLYVLALAGAGPGSGGGPPVGVVLAVAVAALVVMSAAGAALSRRSSSP